MLQYCFISIACKLQLLARYMVLIKPWYIYSTTQLCWPSSLICRLKHVPRSLPTTSNPSNHSIYITNHEEKAQADYWPLHWECVPKNPLLSLSSWRQPSHWQGPQVWWVSDKWDQHQLLRFSPFSSLNILLFLFSKFYLIVSLSLLFFFFINLGLLTSSDVGNSANGPKLRVAYQVLCFVE